tara:strand:+ start:1004 stop:1297 length:294 start_codon:yes stop_codon:yes gene_type:complete
MSYNIIPPKITLETSPKYIPENETEDIVNNPSHYNQNTMETIDVLENSMPRVHFFGYLRGNILKYMLRYEYKGGIEDLKKAQWYLDRLITTFKKPLD